MLRQVYILIFLLIVLSCKQDSLDAQPNFDSISGIWVLKEVETGSYGQKYWTAFAGQTSRKFIFRGDGAVLGADSLLICCAPTSLLVNKQLLEIKPATAPPVNPLCALVNCAPCPQWDIEWKRNELIILYCNGEREKYVRQ